MCAALPTSSPVPSPGAAASASVAAATAAGGVARGTDRPSGGISFVSEAPGEAAASVASGPASEAPSATPSLGRRRPLPRPPRRRRRRARTVPVDSSAVVVAASSEVPGVATSSTTVGVSAVSCFTLVLSSLASLAAASCETGEGATDRRGSRRSERHPNERYRDGASGTCGRACMSATYPTTRDASHGNTSSCLGAGAPAPSSRTTAGGLRPRGFSTDPLRGGLSGTPPPPQWAAARGSLFHFSIAISQLNLRMCTLSNSPTPIRSAIRALPP